MASTDARPIPRKNVAFRVTFFIIDNDGDPVTSAAGLDSEISKDAGAFADCTNEATEIGNGCYYLDLTSTEMNADTVAIIVKTSTTDAKNTPIVLYPEEAGDMRADVTHFGGTAGTFASGRPEVNVSHFGGTAGTFASGRPEVNLTHIAGTSVSTNSAQLGVNVVQISGDAGAANNCESFFDNTGFTASASTIGTATAVTNTVNANMVQISGDSTAADSFEAMLDATPGDLTINAIVLTTPIVANVTAWASSSVATPTVAGVPEVDITHINGSAVSTTSAQLGVNVVQISGDSTAADNLEAFTDGTGYAGGTIKLDTNVVQMSGDAGAADNIEAFFDGTGYNASTSAIGTVATATNVTTVNGLAANVITSSALATSAVDEIVDAVWDEATSGHTSSGTFGQRLQPIRTGTAQAGGASSITLDASASSTTDFYKDALVHVTSGTGSGQSRTITAYNGTTKVATVSPSWGTTPSSDSVFVIHPVGAVSGASAPTASEVADAVWDEARSGHTTSGTFGEGVASVQGNVTGSVASVTGNVGGNVTGSVGSIATGGITSSSYASGAITATAIASDAITAAKIATGAIDADALATDAVDEIWEYATSNITTAGGIGKLIIDNLNATVSSRSSHSAADVWAVATRIVTAATNITSTGGTVPISNGLVLSDVNAIANDTDGATNLLSEYDGTGWGELLRRTVIQTVNSQTSFVLVDGSSDNDAYNGARFVVQDSADSSQRCVGVVSDYTGSTKTITLLNDPGIFTIAAGDIVYILADRSLKSTVDNRTLDVSAAGNAGIDWSNVENAGSTNDLSSTTVFTATNVTAVNGISNDVITAASIAANAIGASELAADAATEIADAILSRNVSNVEGAAGEHTLCTVILAQLEWSISGTTLTIKRTDGSTTHVTKTLTAAAGDPITSVS